MKLKNGVKKYRQIFGYDANWEMIVDCDDADYWLAVLKKCVKKNRRF